MKPSSMRSALAALAVALATCPAFGTLIQGTMSNFDVFNETGTNVYGAEIDLDGLHLGEVTKTYPAHFNNMTMTEYTSGSTFGVKILFTDYNFTPGAPYITPRIGQTTNGHFAVNLPGCEHFGFATSAQPTQTSYFWLDAAAARVGAAPLSIPMTTWNYVAPVGGNPGVMKAVLLPPKPPPARDYPDAVWVKTFETEMSRGVDLEELISSPPSANGVAPQLPSEVEAEWELMEWDNPMDRPDVPLADTDKSVVRRFEYYQYTGAYLDLSEGTHLTNSAWIPGQAPPANELGQFIAANMVAANLEAPAGVPEPSSALLILVSLCGLGCIPRRRSARCR